MKFVIKIPVDSFETDDAVLLVWGKTSAQLSDDEFDKLDLEVERLNAIIEPWIDEEDCLHLEVDSETKEVKLIKPVIEVVPVLTPVSPPKLNPC